jgi:hypothetical protein
MQQKACGSAAFTRTKAPDTLNVGPACQNKKPFLAGAHSMLSGDRQVRIVMHHWIGADEDFCAETHVIQLGRTPSGSASTAIL